ncbi:MAG TPA: TIGR03435 family protein [Vicinamibacterales bacterium]|nr:TIGR03435 family protein [Vicinamibacterales bacterium]
MTLFTLIASAVVLVAPVSAQRDADTARFDVASIKEIPAPDDPRRITCGLPGVMPSGNRIRIPLTQLCGLIRLAYNVDEFQISGIPENRGVGARNFFEVEALVEGDAAPGIIELRPMLRTLLAERFQLQVRREPVEMPVFVLIAADGGPKTTPCSNPQATSGYVAGRIVSCTPLLPMARSAQFLSSATGRMVLDKTGLEPFTFELRWQPDTAEPQPDSPPTLLTAIREQLGLRLQAERAPVDSVVVTRAERPSPN